LQNKNDEVKVDLRILEAFFKRASFLSNIYKNGDRMTHTENNGGWIYMYFHFRKNKNKTIGALCFGKS
jgi:hypothetical protein